MNWKAKNWLIAFAVICATIGFLSGGQALWQKFAVAGPLDQTLQGINGVAGVARASDGKKGDGITFHITLQNAANLQKTYREITEAGEAALGGKKFKVSIRDNRSPELEELYYQLQPQIQESIATGSFTGMAGAIRQQAAARDIQARVFIDSRYIYLQMSKDGAELYQVVPRYPGDQEVG